MKLNYININKMVYKEFTKAMFFSLSKSIPQDYVFTNANREKLNQYLNMVEGAGPEDNLLLQHYKDMNIYCDMHMVDLADQELNFFFKAFQPGHEVLVADLIAQENEVFRCNSTRYPQGTLNYELRAERSDFLVEYLPGKLCIQKGFKTM